MISRQTAKPIKLLVLAVMLLLATACNRHPEVPDHAIMSDEEVSILPDYREVSIPVNIAPLNFSIQGDSIEQCIASFRAGTLSYDYGNGHKVVIDAEEWHELLHEAQDNQITVQLYTQANGIWREHPSFSIFVSGDSIDPYIAYRLIPPYNTYERISLCYRELSTFKEKEFYNNQMLDAPQGGHCVNCHAFQNYRTERMQFHVREEFGSTIIADQGTIAKHNMKRPETISSGVYPAWHPSLDLIAYSTNNSFMEFHTDGLCKSEVQDSRSDLILYDVRKKEVITICNDSALMETFPAWSPDGKWLYYSVADYCADSITLQLATDETHRRIGRQHNVTNHYRDVRYNLCRRSFDAETRTFGEPELILDAASDSLSATLPRISPDGKWLLTCIGEYGCFHIYHPESDLYVMPLDGDSIHTAIPLTEANSTSADSYHNWSSNGRWIVFQSRRRDDNYTRLYFAYFDREGKAHKAFEMPQSNPDYELFNLRSYNIPEFIIEPIRISAADFASVIAQ